MAAPLVPKLHSTPWNARTGLSLFQATLPAAGDYLLDPTGLFRVGSVNFGIQIQAVGGAVTPSLTLGDIELARRDLTAVSWKAFPAISASEMEVLPFAATAIKITASGPCDVIICSI